MSKTIYIVYPLYPNNTNDVESYKYTSKDIAIKCWQQYGGALVSKTVDEKTYNIIDEYTKE